VPRKASYLEGLVIEEEGDQEPDRYEERPLLREKGSPRKSSSGRRKGGPAGSLEKKSFRARSPCTRHGGGLTSGGGGSCWEKEKGAERRVREKVVVWRGGPVREGLLPEGKVEKGAALPCVSKALERSCFG